MRKFLKVFVLLFMSGLAMNVSAGSLTGLWVGYYSYDTGDRVPMSMVLQQAGVSIYGNMIEPQTFGDEVDVGKQAIVVGELEQDIVAFEKVYGSDIVNWDTFEMKPGSSVIIYRLVLSPDGNQMSGNWQIGNVSGRATFKRVTPGGPHTTTVTRHYQRV